MLKFQDVHTAWLLKVAYWWQLQVADTVCGLMEIFLEPLSTFCSYIVATANCIGLMCIPDYNIDTERPEYV